MKKFATGSLALALGLMLGVATDRTLAPRAAVAQEPPATSAPTATPMTTNGMQGMPMQGGGMHATPAGSMNGMPSCAQMQTMMQHMMSADRAMMQPMMQMHNSMMMVHLTGNADHDFVAMMIPHHEGAIAMAQAELKYGKNPKALALAKSIIAAHQKEIDEMQSWKL